VAKGNEDYNVAAQDLFTLVRDAQGKYPNQERVLYLDIDEHRNSANGFDADMLELQKHYMVGILGKYLTEVHMPLGAFKTNSQDNDIPDVLTILPAPETAK
jgi:cellulose biosynthesis protein BcsQ